MAMLEIRDLNVYYGGIHALKGISLEVEEGQIVSMIGSNGAGKSSMMNAISGIVKYKSGEILYKGQPLPTAANKVVRLGVCQVPGGPPDLREPHRLREPEGRRVPPQRQGRHRARPQARV